MYEVSGDATAAGPGPHLENQLLPSSQKDRQLEETQDISAGEKKKKILRVSVSWNSKQTCKNRFS